MEQLGGDIFGTIERLINLGVPLAMLIVVVWLLVKYAPSGIKALQDLGGSVGKNTIAVNELKITYDLQVNKLSVITTQLQSLSDTIDTIETNQVKLTDYSKMYALIESVHGKLDDLAVKMATHVH